MKLLIFLLLMATKIAASVDGTGQPGQAWQCHLVGLTQENQWLVFYTVGTATTIATAFGGTDGTSWTAGTSSPAFPSSKTNQAFAGNFSIDYQNISANEVIHCDAEPATSTTSAGEHDHIRATVASGAITWGSWAAVGTGASNPVAGSFPTGNASLIDGAQRPIATAELITAVTSDANVFRATNTDSGSSWTAGFGTVSTPEAVTNEVNGSILLDTGSGNVLMLWENAASAESSSMTQVRWSQWTSSWSAAADVFASTFTAEAANNYGAVAVSSTDVHCVVRTGSNTFTHRRFNGSTWSAGDTVPNSTCAAGSGIFMATDGTSAWMVTTDGASGNINYIKWTSGVGWDSVWTNLVSTGQTISGVGGWRKVFNGNVGVLYSQVNGIHVDLWFASFSAGAAATASKPTYFPVHFAASR